MVLFVLILWFFSPILLGAFSRDPAVVAVGTVMILWSVAIEFGRQNNTVLLSALKGLADTAWPAATSIGVTWLVALPMAYLLAITCDYGYQGVLVALALDQLLRAFANAARWHDRMQQFLRLQLAKSPLTMARLTNSLKG